MKVRRVIFLTFVSAILLVPVASSQNTDPASAVREFYEKEMKASQTFNRRNLDARKKWLSPRLYNLFRNELKKQSALLKTNPDDKPFFGDGFPFRPMDEPCEVNGKSYSRRFIVQAAINIRDSGADIPVRFSYPSPCTVPTLTYTVRAVRSSGRWVIDDIIFDNNETLSAAMKNNSN